MSLTDQIEKLVKLREQGLLTDEEFKQAKASLLGDLVSGPRQDEEPSLASKAGAREVSAPQISEQISSFDEPEIKLDVSENTEGTSDPETGANASIGNYIGNRKAASHNSTRQTESYNDSNNLWGCGVLILIFISISIIGMNLENSNSKSPQTSSSQKQSSNKPPMARYQRAIRMANKAVLKREHQRAINNLYQIKHGYTDFSNISIKKVNSLIKASEKQIKLLDQPGNSKYYETESYGYQWFDKDIKGVGFKLFFAHSRECVDPNVTFQFRRRSGGPIEATYVAKPKSHTFTLVVPFQWSGSQTINSEPIVKCN